MLDCEGITTLIKISGPQRRAARVVLHGRSHEEAVARALRIGDAAGATLIPAPAADGRQVREG